MKYRSNRHPACSNSWAPVELTSELGDFRIACFDTERYVATFFNLLQANICAEKRWDHSITH